MKKFFVLLSATMLLASCGATNTSKSTATKSSTQVSSVASSSKVDTNIIAIPEDALYSMATTNKHTAIWFTKTGEYEFHSKDINIDEQGRWYWDGSKMVVIRNDGAAMVSTSEDTTFKFSYKTLVGTAQPFTAEISAIREKFDTYMTKSEFPTNAVAGLSDATDSSKVIVMGSDYKYTFMVTGAERKAESGTWSWNGSVLTLVNPAEATVTSTKANGTTTLEYTMSMDETVKATFSISSDSLSTTLYNYKA